jgi:putative DNA primase/helicase
MEKQSIFDLMAAEGFDMDAPVFTPDMEYSDSKYVKDEEDLRDMSMIAERCKFVSYCKDNIDIVDYHNKFALMSILAHGINGNEVAHDYFGQMPTYKKHVTEQHYKAAYKADMPQTCTRIMNDVGFDCPSGGCKKDNGEVVKSPIEFAKVDVSDILNWFEDVPEPVNVVAITPQAAVVNDKDRLLKRFTPEGYEKLAKLHAEDEDNFFEIMNKLTLKITNANKNDKALLPTVAKFKKDVEAAIKGMDKATLNKREPWWDAETGFFNANVLAAEMVKKKPMIYMDSKFWVYNNGYYEKYDNIDFLSSDIKKILKLKSDDRYEEKTITQLRNDNILRERFTPDIEYINVKNGLLNWKKGKLLPHDPDIKCIHQINADWIEENYTPICPTIDRFLSDIFPADCIDMLWQFFGYSMIASTKAQKMWILLGEGKNGKSRFIQILKALIGKKNCSNESFKNLTGERFNTINLNHKLLNICDDMESAIIDYTAKLKMLVEGAELSAEYKGVQSFDIEPYARLLVALNNIPRMKDTTYGLYRRLMIVPMFKEITKEDRDPDIVEKMEKELDGMLYKAVMALQALANNKMEFVDPPSCIAELNKFKVVNDPVLAFLTECVKDSLESQKKDFIKRSVLFDSYREWCKSAGHHNIGKASFNSQVETKYKFKLITVDGVRRWENKVETNEDIDDDWELNSNTITE